MSQHIQVISQQFYENRSERNFNKLYHVLKPIIYGISYKVLKNHPDSEENVSLVFTKIYNSTTFTFDKSKSYLSYIYTIAFNNAKMLYNKGRIVYNRGTEEEYRLKRFVFESDLVMDDEDVRDNILDYLNSANSTDTSPIEPDEAYLHNSTDHQFKKTLEIIGNLDKENGTEGVSQIIMDALCNDMMLGSLRKMEGVIDADTRNNILSSYAEIKKKVNHRGKRINMVTVETGVEKEIVKNVIGIKDIVLKEIKHYSTIARQYGLTIPDDILTYEQVAEKHGLNTVGAVKTKVFRAKKQIRKELVAQIRLSERVDGKIITGEERAYFDSGELKHSVVYLNGQYHGKLITYHKNGKKKIEAIYEFGVLNGKYIESYNNGIIKNIGNYKNGDQVGKWVGRNIDDTIDNEYDYCGDAIFFDHYDKDGVIEDSGIFCHEDEILEEEEDAVFQ